MKKIYLLLSCVLCLVHVANSQTVVYNIPYAQTINLPTFFGCSGTDYYNGCTGDMGFSWTSTNAGTPSSVIVSFNYDIECGTGTNAYGTTLNGAAQPGTFTPPYDCGSCLPDNVYTIFCNPANYLPLSTNTFMINSSALGGCVGMATSAGLGGYYAQVTVNYGPPTPPPNDNPCSATALTVNPTVCGGYNYYSNTLASNSPGVPAPGCAGYSGGDVWFTAVVPASGIIAFDTQQGVITDGGMAVYSGSCGALSLVACNDNGSSNPGMPLITLTGQTPGNTLWIRVWENGNNNNGSFGICAYSPPPPLCYASGSIPFAPDAYAGSTVSLSDDQYSPIINIGFNFCIDGTSYNQLLIGSNGYVDFDLGSASGYCPWPISGPIPTTNPMEIMRSILSPWQDLYPPGGGQIRYQTLGTAPNRRFVVSWSSVPMYSCTGLLNTSQLKLFESSNCIEIHLANKPLCAGWNGGQAIEGYDNFNGIQSFFVGGRNAPTQWAVTNDAWRFSPTCTPCSTASTSTCIVPLPVELSSFNGHCNNGNVNVQWTTSSEINNDYFIVERSADGINYKEIGRIKGNGNSNQHHSYQYDDLFPVDGNGYYRLKQVDYNGEFRLYDPMTVHCSPDMISLYPNPTRGEFKIIGANLHDEIVVSDPAGNILLQTKASGNIHPMNLGKISAGVYFITITHDGSTVVKKLVID